MPRERRQPGEPRVPNSTFGLLLLAPVLIWVAAVIVYPTAYVVWLSFQNATVIGAPTASVGLRNYQTVLREPLFWNALRNSIVWTASNAFLQTLLGFTTALLLNYPLRRYKIAQPIVIMPWIVPTVVMAVMWQFLLSASYGVVNNLLVQLDLLQRPINFLGDPRISFPLVVVLNSWRWFPFFTVIVLAALQNIPQDEYNAATLEGASFLLQFRRITMPYLAPTLGVMLLVGNILSFGVFDVIYLMTNGGPMNITMTLPVYIYKRTFEGYRMSEAATIASLTFVFLAGFSAVVLSWPWLSSLRSRTRRRIPESLDGGRGGISTRP